MAKESNSDNQGTRICPKDCSKCSFQQHAFCAAQMSFYLMEKVHNLEGKIDALNSKIEHLESSKDQSVDLINPLAR